MKLQMQQYIIFTVHCHKDHKVDMGNLVSDAAAKWMSGPVSKSAWNLAS